MKRIQISYDGQTLDADAIHRIQAVGMFPDNERDIEAAIALQKLYTDWVRRYGPGFDGGEISRATTKLLQQKMSQVTICGCVAIVMIEHDKSHKNLGLQAAAKVVSEAAYFHKTGSWYVNEFSGNEEVKSFRLTADPSDIRKVFRRYSAVAHIAAARLAIDEFVDGPVFPDPNLHLNKIFIKTAADFQLKLQRLKGSERWGMWDLAGNLPGCLAGVRPIEPSQELLETLFGPSGRR
jgi:hypothetical protein